MEEIDYFICFKVNDYMVSFLLLLTQCNIAMRLFLINQRFHDQKNSIELINIKMPVIDKNLIKVVHRYN